MHVSAYVNMVVTCLSKLRACLGIRILFSYLRVSLDHYLKTIARQQFQEIQQKPNPEKKHLNSRHLFCLVFCSNLELTNCLSRGLFSTLDPYFHDINNHRRTKPAATAKSHNEEVRN